MAHAKAARKAGRKLTPLAGRENKPRQKRLPQMDDPAIEGLESLAEAYAGIRDKRIALTKEEVDLQDSLLAEMKKHGKQTYHHGGITCTLVHEKEKVRVKIAKEKE